MIFPCPRTRLIIWSRETGTACSFSILKLNLVPTHGTPPDFRGASIYLLNRHTPSGQSRVSQVTQLRTNGARCREPAGTGPVVLKVVPVTGASILQVTMDQFMCTSFQHPLTRYKLEHLKMSTGTCIQSNKRLLIIPNNRVERVSWVNSDLTRTAYCCLHVPISIF